MALGVDPPFCCSSNCNYGNNRYTDSVPALHIPAFCRQVDRSRSISFLSLLQGIWLYYDKPIVAKEHWEFEGRKAFIKNYLCVERDIRTFLLLCISLSLQPQSMIQNERRSPQFFQQARILFSGAGGEPVVEGDYLSHESPTHK